MTIKEALQDLIEAYKLKPKLHQTNIRSTWAELMGPAITKYTSDVKMVGKTLHITIDSAPLRQELSYSREKIKNLLNESLGEEYIQEVIVR
ncbi:MAG: DUF721 domain-containing protein [Saprospiraceae bacterium]|nr:DUF721 domain-containing protein [Saprospiraceae bacterium]